MCSVTTKLPTHLKLKYENSKISIYDGNENIAKATDLISEGTGSRSFVYKIMCNGPNGVFSIIAKIQKSKGERLEGLVYEKMIYSLMTKIVDSGVCPFRLRCYKMFEPTNILITETFSNMIDLGQLLKTFHENANNYHADDCYNILIQILYAIEVNYRVGIRHNDLHMNNIMIHFCPFRETKKLLYLNREKDSKKTLTMENCSFIVKFFDNDRATKLKPKNMNVNNIYQKSYNPKPVLNLFPWHEPAVYTEKLDMFKIMQHIRDESLSPLLNELLKSLNVSFSKSEKKKKSMAHGRKNFMKYHLVTNKQVRKEPLAIQCSNAKTSNDACTSFGKRGHFSSTFSSTFPSWLDELNSPEEALMILATKPHRFTKTNSSVVVGDMSKLYVKRRIS